MNLPCHTAPATRSQNAALNRAGPARMHLNVELDVSGLTDHVASSFQSKLFAVVRLCVTAHNDPVVKNIHFEAMDASPGSLHDLPLDRQCQFCTTVRSCLCGHHLSLLVPQSLLSRRRCTCDDLAQA